jgi:hypothetical protein
MTVFISFLIYDLIKKYKRLIFQDGIIITFAIVLTLSHYPLYKQVDHLRFGLWETKYDTLAKEVAVKLRNADDIYWDIYYVGDYPFIIEGKFVYYMKKEENIVLILPTDTGNITGYVYFLSDESKAMFEQPSKYWSQYVLYDNIYDYYKPISNRWSYVHFY